MTTATTTSMTQPDENLCAQLCAYMDGELPADEARFLERRLANEPALQAKWLRLQVASSCLKQQPFQPMAVGMCARIADGLARSETVAPARRPWRTWAIAASVALLAVAFAPRLIRQQPDGSGPGATLSLAAATPSAEAIPSPSSADFAVPAGADAAVASEAPVVVAEHPRTTVSDAAPNLAASDSQDLAVTSDSPADFPLVESGTAKSWPRAEMPGANNDPSIEAYLVRHNQMLANDGLGGFVPYVDVVANPGDKQ